MTAQAFLKICFAAVWILEGKPVLSSPAAARSLAAVRGRQICD